MTNIERRRRRRLAEVEMRIISGRGTEGLVREAGRLREQIDSPPFQSPQPRPMKVLSRENLIASARRANEGDGIGQIKVPSTVEVAVPDIESNRATVIVDLSKSGETLPPREITNGMRTHFLDYPEPTPSIFQSIGRLREEQVGHIVDRFIPRSPQPQSSSCSDLEGGGDLSSRE